MKQILAATDFSTRADRALRRATLLAQEAGAQLVLVHVVDEDLPPRLLEAETLEATALLQELAATVTLVDAVPCAARLAVGEPFQAISALAEELDTDLIIMGQHRRQALRDVFVGTTVERTIRESLRPLIMANAPPTGPYERVLAATDFSEGSANAPHVAQNLGFFERAKKNLRPPCVRCARPEPDAALLGDRAAKTISPRKRSGRARNLTNSLASSGLSPTVGFWSLPTARRRK
jgi:nucleotide-binding universal stress UspA family protein